jgi:hypothetical protein
LEFSYGQEAQPIVRAFTLDTPLASAIASATGANPEGLVASYDSKTLNKSLALSAIPYAGGPIVLTRVATVTFHVLGAEIAQSVAEGESVFDVKARLASAVPTLAGEIELVTARVGRLGDSDIFLTLVDPDEVVSVVEPPRYYKFKNAAASNGEEHKKSFDREARVADALSALSRRFKGRQFKLFLASPDAPLDPSLVLDQVVPPGTPILYLEEKLQYTIEFQGQAVNLAIEPSVTFKDLKPTLLPYLLPGQTVDESQYGFFINGRDVSEKKESHPVRSVAKGVTVLELRARDARQMFQYTKDGKSKRKPLRIPQETTITDLYFYWLRRLGMHVSLWIPAGKINRRATARLTDCGFGDLMIDVRTKDLKYFFQLPGVEGLSKIRLPATETVKQFKDRLKVGQTTPIEIDGAGEPIRPTRVKLVYQGEVLRNEITFFELHIEEDLTRVIEVTLHDPHFTFILDGERIRLRIPAGLPLDEAERRISEQLRRQVYFTGEFSEPFLRETNRAIELASNTDLQPGDVPPPIAYSDIPPVEFDRLRQITKYPGADGGSTILFGDDDTQEQWVLIYPADGRFLPIPPVLQPLAVLDHPAILAVRSLTSSTQPVPLYCVEYTVGSLAAPSFSGWDNTTMTIGIVGLVLGLRFLHYQGIAHGAIRPGNVFVNQLHRPKLGPSGVGRLDDVTIAAYVAPEIRAGAPVSAAADIFSLAVTVYEIVTNGRRAFPARSVQELATLQGAPAPEFPEYIEPSIAQLFRRAWAPNPADRPTANDLFAEFMEIGFLPVTLDDVDGKVVVEYVTTVIAWETTQGVDVNEEV